MRYKLNKTDGKKILTGFGIAMAGAALTYGAEVIPNIDFEAWTPLVTGLAAVLVNFLRKWLAKK